MSVLNVWDPINNKYVAVASGVTVDYATQADMDIVNAELVDMVHQPALDTTNSNFANLQNNMYTDFNSFVQSVVTGSPIATGQTRINKDAIPKTGTLKSINLYIDIVGSIKIKAFSLNTDGTFKERWEFTLSTSLGLKTYNSGIDFPVLKVQSGWFLGYYGITGQIAYTAGSVGSYYFGGEATGNNTIFTNSGSTLSMSYIVTEVKIDLASDYSCGTAYISGSPYAFLQTSTRIAVINPTKAGKLSKVTVNVDSAGTLKIKFFSLNTDGTYKWQKEFNVPCIAGTNVFVDGAHFNNIMVDDNWYLGIFSSTVKIAYSSISGEANKSGTVTGDNTVSNAALSLSGYSIALSAEILLDSNSNNNANRISTLESKTTSKKAIISTTFPGTIIPQDFVISGTWVVNNGLQSPASGDISTTVVWNKYQSLDRLILRTRIKINDITSRFALIFKNSMYDGSNGTIAEVDCNTKKLNLYNQWNGSTTLPTISKSADISLTFVAGRDYLVSFIKNAGTKTFVITDTVTQAFTTVTLDENIDLIFCGTQVGAPGIMFFNGNILVEKLEFITPVGKGQILTNFGDSITEGNSLYNQVGGYTNRYCYLLSQALNGKVAIGGKSGETSAGLLVRFELDYFTSDYTLILIGTNDTDYTTWWGNLNAIIARIIAKGSIPILGTIPPRSDRQTFIDQANAYIRSSGYIYVDFDYALTLNNDGVTQNSSMFLGDAIHPNPTGHTAMFNQCKIDLPFLFD